VVDSIDTLKQQGYDVAAVRPRIAPAQVQAATEKMREFAADPVDITIGKFTRNMLRTGLTPFGGSSVKDAVCSGIIGAAYPKPLADRKPYSMRPKDFMESRKVTHVVGFSPDEVKEKAAGMRSLAGKILGGK
jgi:hypothetical protein